MATAPIPAIRVNFAATVPLILLNKPYRVLCQFSDDQGRRTLADFVDVPGVYPAGRLDFDSEGLVLLTDDGRLQHRIAEPQHKLDKAYQVQVEGEPDAGALRALCQGVALKDGVATALVARRISEPAALWPRTPPVRDRKQIPTSWLEIVIDEGRNRQIRRMTAAVGLPALRLIRRRIGPWALEALQPGETASIDTRRAWRRLENYRPTV